MNFNFEIVLSVLVLVTGGIWLFDFLLTKFFKRKTAEQVTATKDEKQSETEDRGVLTESYHFIVEASKFLFPVVVIVLFLRSFIAEPFKIPSRSMLPTLKVDDLILVNKFSYGIRLPVFHHKIIDTGSPERGDIFVFRYPRDPSVNYIKRVIGLPGDKIKYYDKVLYINGEKISQSYQDSYEIEGIGSAWRLSETLGDAQHDMLHLPQYPSRNGEWEVPEGHYFAMGDNRDNSNDSRGWGVVPEENLVGKAFFIWFNTWELSRIGTVD